MILKSDQKFFSAFLENTTEDNDSKISTFEIVTKGKSKTFKTNSKTLEKDVKNLLSGKAAIDAARKLAAELMKPEIKINTTKFNFPVFIVVHQQEDL